MSLELAVGLVVVWVFAIHHRNGLPIFHSFVFFTITANQRKRDAITVLIKFTDGLANLIAQYPIMKDESSHIDIKKIYNTRRKIYQKYNKNNSPDEQICDCNQTASSLHGKHTEAVDTSSSYTHTAFRN